MELDDRHRWLRVALAAGSVDLNEAPKELANAINEVEGLETEHKEVKARQSAEWKKLRVKITSLAWQIRRPGRYVLLRAVRGSRLPDGDADELRGLRVDTLGDFEQCQRVWQVAAYAADPDGIVHLGRVVQQLVGPRPIGQRLQQAPVGVGWQPDADHAESRIDTPFDFANTLLPGVVRCHFVTAALGRRAPHPCGTQPPQLRLLHRWLDGRGSGFRSVKGAVAGGAAGGVGGAIFLSESQFRVGVAL